MTIYEIQILYRDLIDNLSSNSYPEVPVQQMDRAFNNAVAYFINQRYGLSNIPDEGVDETEKRKRDLSTLVTPFVEIEKVGSGSYKSKTVQTTVFKYPSDMWYSLSERALISIEPCPPFYYKKDCGEIKKVKKPNEEHYVPLFDRQHLQLNTILEDSLNVPKDKELIYVVNSINNEPLMEVYHDIKVEVKKVLLSYVREFTKMNINKTYTRTEGALNWKTLEYWMPNSTHYEIARLAALMTLEMIEQPRLNTLGQIISKQE